MRSFLGRLGSNDPVVSREGYGTFISIMFSAAMLFWGATFLGLKNLPIPTSEPSVGVINIPRGEYLLAGILYGGVLISFYWLYSEKLASKSLPSNLGVLLLDFVALSFLTGAAATWRNKSSFNSLALWTLMLLSCRFLIAALATELFPSSGRRPAFRQMIMCHTLLVYALCFIFIGGVSVGAAGADPQRYQRLFYMFISLGMSIGIGVTAVHSLMHAAEKSRKTAPILTHDSAQPALIPAYGTIHESEIRRVAKQVFLGEERFRRILNSDGPDWLSSFQFHQSRVHTYRDVETQAFIMSHHADDDDEIELRAMWVYLAHWFDDFFDDQYVGNLANSNLQEDFNISEVLGDLDKGFKDVWSKAVNETKRHKTWNRNRDLHETGFRRLMLSGPMFSARCRGQHDLIRQRHWDLITRKLTAAYGVRDLIYTIKKVNERYICYTSKVVVEIWDSFASGVDFNLSMLMNLFYAPGLFYHDAEAEFKQDEIVMEPKDDSSNGLVDTLQAVFDCIRNLPSDKRKLALRPARMFINAFEVILETENLIKSYKDFISEQEIKDYL